MSDLVDQIDALLPQTQCQRCTYFDCYEYANAIANGEAEINQCPPGGDEVIASLAQLLGRNALPLNTDHGAHQLRHVAVIDETTCIGCARCITACPVDAILGAFKLMHTVIAEECTGCELCLPPCPVDCIVMRTAPPESAVIDAARASRARIRHRFREERLARMERETDERLRAKAGMSDQKTPTSDAVKDAVQRALSRKKTPRE